MAMPNVQSPAAAAVVVLARYVERDPARVGGVPVFRGSRVPVRGLSDHLQAGDAIETFLDDFPDVTREQAEGVIDLAGRRLIAEVPTR